MRFVLLINGMALMAFAALMGLMALLYPATTEVFEEALLMTGLVGGLLATVSGSHRQSLRPRDGFVMTASVWMTAALAGGLPLWLWQLSPADAFFEAMSGLTTTGSTVMSGLDTTPRGILMWRAILQAMGGIGFIVTGVALLPILKVGGMQLFRTESSEQGEKEFATAARFAVATIVVYFGLMAVCAALYGIGGMSVFDAVTHAMTTLSTGGYSNYDASFGHFDSAFLQYTASVFMLAGGLPFAWYIRAAVRGVFTSEQVRMLLAFVLGVAAILTFWLVEARGWGLEEAFRQSLFNVASVVTTTGYATDNYLAWGSFATTVFFLLTAVGGCTGSTAGGAKMMRWVVFFRAVGREVRRLYAPHVTVVARYEGRRIEEDVFSGVAAFFALYFGTVATLAWVLAALGLDPLTAISGALTAVANVGPGVGSIIGPAGNFEPLGDWAKYALSIGMYLGRLEMMTVLVLLVPAFWREF